MTTTIYDVKEAYRFNMTAQEVADIAVQTHEEIMGLEPEAMYLWWIHQNHRENAKMFAENPGLIRTFLVLYQMFTTTWPENQGIWIHLEVVDAVDEFGLDPIWRDYVPQHFPESEVLNKPY